MLIYSSALKDDTHLGELIAHQHPAHTSNNQGFSRFNTEPVNSRLFFNRMFAFTALLSINACTYLAAQALLQA